MVGRKTLLPVVRRVVGVPVNWVRLNGQVIILILVILSLFFMLVTVKLSLVPLLKFLLQMR